MNHNMKNSSTSEPRERVIAPICVGEHGLITVPPRYRRAHGLGKGSRMLAVEVADGLVLIPSDDALERLSERLQTALARHGVTADQAVRNLDKIRRRRFQRRHGPR
jgi:bifunctional DNA-binding transcriptional regulator/antitoxin component of YhaV-PrlF toxin-antitoxin module